ncbi:unnamed protein product [Polarella glacialis]|uniref:Uncharacterized protein n=1 Tax=Polarella glacialis TaxID=89957 RepID=A0A813K8Z5_POLGL|nr:unnamed protein product [Polarella glacialis]
MMAIIGMFFQDGLTGSAWGDWALYTDSPLRAFESELGVQGPIGFWDPLGFTKGGDAASFRRRRFVELKHGRQAMLACIGYIVPEYYRWDAFLSPSQNLKFADVPSGLAALSKVPGSGWAQMIAFAGSVELFQYVDEPDRAPGDFRNAGALGIPNGFVTITDPEILQLRAQELKHGRVAMAAILGWFHVAAGYMVTQLPMGGMWQLVFTILCVEWAVTYVCKPNEKRPWDIFGWSDVVADEEFPDWKKAQLQELNNGRLAMLGIVGLVVQDAMFGDYAAGIGQACFGAEMCKNFDKDAFEFWPVLPSAPYNWPALYPHVNVVDAWLPK